VRERPSGWPLVVTACADCGGVGTNRIGEWYMVRDNVWEQAWRGRRKPWQVLPGQQVLCISCLEQRLGRTLMVCDFLSVPAMIRLSVGYRNACGVA
jgi:hypothetical protein